MDSWAGAGCRSARASTRKPLLVRWSTTSAGSCRYVARPKSCSNGFSRTTASPSPGLEPDEQVAVGDEHPGELGEDGRQTVGRRVDDRVPGGDADRAAVVEGQVVEHGLPEPQARVGGPRLGQHPGRHVEAHDVDASFPEQGRDATGPAPDIDDHAGRAGHPLRELVEEGPVEPSLELVRHRRADLVGVRRRARVVRRSCRCRRIVRAHRASVGAATDTTDPASVTHRGIGPRVAAGPGSQT